MTTLIHVKVPPHAGYTVLVRLQEKVITRKSDPDMGWAEGQVTILEAGDAEDFCIFSERRILIQEIPKTRTPSLHDGV